MSSILGIVIRLLSFEDFCTITWEKNNSSNVLLPFLDIVSRYCKDFRGGWYLDREGILINSVPHKNWHYPLYWQKPTSARPGHCKLHRCHLFREKSSTTLPSFWAFLSSLIFLQLIDLFSRFGHLLDAEMNLKLAKTASSLAAC